MNGTYPTLITIIEEFLKESERLGIGDHLSKGGLGTIVLAHHLGHEIAIGDKGADGRDVENNKLYEYKVSTTDQFPFNFGPRKKQNCQSVAETIHKKFDPIEGAYCGERKGVTIKALAYCPMKTLIPYLIDHFSKVVADQLTITFSMAQFLKVQDARKLIT